MERELAAGVLVGMVLGVLLVLARRDYQQKQARTAAAAARRADRQAREAQIFALERVRLLTGHPLGPLALLPPDAKVVVTTPPIREVAPVAPAPVAPAPVPLVETAPTLVVPSTRALLDQGVIAVGRPLVQGWAAGGPLLGTPEQTFTAAIGGKSRSGKTRTMALIIGQMVLHGAHLLVIDPHRHKADALTKLIAPLLPWCLLPPAFSMDEIKAVIERGEAEMTARRNGQHLDAPLLLVIDEYTLVQRAGAHIEWGPKQTLASRAAGLVESVATEGGGMGMKGLIGGQNWKGTRAGGTEVRQMLQSAWVHRSWAEQARYLVPDTDLADQAESLVPGRAIFVPSDDDPILVGMPLTERTDLERIAAMAPPPGASRFGAGAEPVRPPVRPPLRVVPAEPGGDVGSELGDDLGIEYNGRLLPTEFISQVRALFDAGLGPSEITRDLSGGKTGGDLAVKVGLVYKALVAQLRAELARYRQEAD